MNTSPTQPNPPNQVPPVSATAGTTPSAPPRPAQTQESNPLQLSLSPDDFRALQPWLDRTLATLRKNKLPLNALARVEDAIFPNAGQDPTTLEALKFVRTAIRTLDKGINYLVTQGHVGHGVTQELQRYNPYPPELTWLHGYAIQWATHLAGGPPPAATTPPTPTSSPTHVNAPRATIPTPPASPVPSANATEASLSPTLQQATKAEAAPTTQTNPKTQQVRPDGYTAVTFTLPATLQDWWAAQQKRYGSKAQIIIEALTALHNQDQVEHDTAITSALRTTRAQTLIASAALQAICLYTVHRIRALFSSDQQRSNSLAQWLFTNFRKTLQATHPTFAQGLAVSTHYADLPLYQLATLINAEIYTHRATVAPLQDLDPLTIELEQFSAFVKQIAQIMQQEIDPSGETQMLPLSTDFLSVLTAQTTDPQLPDQPEITTALHKALHITDTATEANRNRLTQPDQGPLFPIDYLKPLAVFQEVFSLQLAEIAKGQSTSQPMFATGPYHHQTASSPTSTPPPQLPAQTRANSTPAIEENTTGTPIETKQPLTDANTSEPRPQ